MQNGTVLQFYDVRFDLIINALAHCNKMAGALAWLIMWVWSLTQGTRGHAVSKESHQRAAEDLREGGAIRQPRPLLETPGCRRQVFQLL